MHKNATKCNETLSKWCKNKHGASKIMDTLETYQYLLRIVDLEGRLSLMKRQASTAMAQASKSYGLMKQVSILEDKLSGSVAEVMHLKDCDSFLVEFIESACEQLKCKYPVDVFFEILVASLVVVF
jgi:hypothetical protein